MTELGRAVFLDRDGVLNQLIVRDGRNVSPRLAGEFKVYDEAAGAVRDLRALGFRVFVVSNQPDVARGLLDDRELERMSATLHDAIAPDEIAVCRHDDADRCACRKPAPGMLLDLARRWSVDLAGSFMVGDSWRDIEAGRRAGCITILVARDTSPGHFPSNLEADAYVESLAAAARYISSRT